MSHTQYFYEGSRVILEADAGHYGTQYLQHKPCQLGGRGEDHLLREQPAALHRPERVFFRALLRFVGGAVVGGVGAVGTVFGGAGKQVAYGIGNTAGGAAKKVVKAAATEALWDSVEDAAKRVLVDGKDPGGLDY